MKNKKEKSKTTKTLIIIVIILNVIVLGLILTKFIIPGINEYEDNKPLKMDENQQDYAIPEEEVDHSKNIVLPGWASFTIPKNTKDVDKGIDFYNPDKNFWYVCPECGAQLDDNYKCMNEKCGKQADANADTDCYYMTFSLVLTNNDEVIYESGLVEPGKHLQHIELTRPLPEGDYDAYVLIQPYKSDRATACNNGIVKITLYVR